MNRISSLLNNAAMSPARLRHSIQAFAMINRKFISFVLVLLVVIFGSLAPLNTSFVSAAEGELGSCVDADNDPATVGCGCEGDFTPSVDGTSCVPVSQTDCAGEDGAAAVTLNKDNCQIVAYLIIAINFLTAAAGIAIVGGMVYGGYLYLTARDNPGQIQAGRSRIVWSLIALLLLIFGYAALQWLVPGGVLNGQAPEGPL